MSGYGTTQISGLTRPKATINRSKLAGINASRVSGTQISERNIVLTVVPQGDGETLRQKLYHILPFDTKLRFYIKTATRKVFIDGYVEDLGGDADEPNGEEFAVQVSIICPFPWFQSVEFHEETFSDQQMVAVNKGDIPCGFTFYMDEPTNGYKISFIRGFKFYVGETIFQTKIGLASSSGRFNIPMILSTLPGEKMFYVKVDGSYTSMAFSLIDASSEWQALQPGENIVSMSCQSYQSPSSEEGAILDWDQWMRLTWRDTYSGV